MSNSRSPRAVRSTTMGTRGMVPHPSLRGRLGCAGHDRPRSPSPPRRPRRVPDGHARRAPARADGPASARPGSSASATPTSPARPAAGPATPTTARRTIDALGSTAYYDNAAQHRRADRRAATARKSAEVYIGGGVNGVNLACSGAKTSTFTDGAATSSPASTSTTRAAKQGQALMLQHFAATHNVKMVALVDRRQQLQLRLDRADVRRGLADLAVVVAGLLQRRLAR